MPDITTTSLHSVKLPDYRGENVVSTQFGMRYPDGNIQWGYDYHPTGAIRFEDLDNGAVTQAWRRRLEERAAAANIQISEYLEGHELLQRTVIVAVTEAKEV